MVIPRFAATVVVRNGPADSREVHRWICHDLRRVVAAPPASNNVNRRSVGDGSGKRPANRRNHYSSMFNQAHQRFKIELVQRAFRRSASGSSPTSHSSPSCRSATLITQKCFRSSGRPASDNRGQGFEESLRHSERTVAGRITAIGFWWVNCAGPKDGKSSAAGVTPNCWRIASNIEPRRRCMWSVEIFASSGA